CKDGVLYLIAVEQDQWNRLMEFMGSPEWSHSERFGSTLLRGEPETMAFINARVSEWTAEWEVLPLFHACQERRLGAAPLYTAAGLAQDPHLVARNFFQPHSHPRLGTVRLPGAPYRLERPWWRPGAPAPRLGDANTTPGAVPGDLFPVRRPSLPSTGPVTGAPVTPSEKAPDHSLPRPLEGVRVLDLTWVWAGPYTSQLLAFLGAQVIKVEHPRRLDLARRLNLFAQGMEPGPNRNGYFNQLGQDKLSLHLDLAHPEGLELGLRLVERCDVVLSNFGTGVMERLGLGRDVLRKRNPVLIQGLISAFGQDGPYRNYTGYGPGMIPMSGIGALTGYEIDGAPQNLRAAYADPNAGMYLALAVVASLADRDRTGQGQVIDVALWEAMLHTGFEVWLPFALGSPLPKPQENHHPLHAPHNLYRCLGADPWLAVSVMEFSQWAGLCAALKRPDLASDATLATPAGRKAREQELDALLRDWCAGQEKWVATAILQRHGVPALPSLSNRELSENPHLEAWGFLEHREHPESGRRTHTGVPWRMARRPNGVRRRAPLLGEHTSEVLRTLLEMEEGELERLRGLGVIG
ncbi:MAG: CoA transferase, partial [Deltaproteobacteria bacterium]|nr:CoA transferase [Deltaproteobacteria bacterium]